MFKLYANQAYWNEHIHSDSGKSFLNEIISYLIYKLETLISTSNPGKLQQFPPWIFYHDLLIQ